jgi:hypothetical protein
MWQPLPPHGACGLWQATQHTFEKPLTQSAHVTAPPSFAGSGYEASAGSFGGAASAKGSSAHGSAADPEAPLPEGWTEEEHAVSASINTATRIAVTPRGL